MNRDGHEKCSKCEMFLAITGRDICLACDRVGAKPLLKEYKKKKK